MDKNLLYEHIYEEYKPLFDDLKSISDSESLITETINKAETNTTMLSRKKAYIMTLKMEMLITFITNTFDKDTYDFILDKRKNGNYIISNSFNKNLKDIEYIKIENLSSDFYMLKMLGSSTDKEYQKIFKQKINNEPTLKDYIVKELVFLNDWRKNQETKLYSFKYINELDEKDKHKFIIKDLEYDIAVINHKIQEAIEKREEKEDKDIYKISVPQQQGVDYSNRKKAQKVTAKTLKDKAKNMIIEAQRTSSIALSSDIKAYFSMTETDEWKMVSFYFGENTNDKGNNEDGPTVFNQLDNRVLDSMVRLSFKREGFFEKKVSEFTFRNLLLEVFGEENTNISKIQYDNVYSSLIKIRSFQAEMYMKNSKESFALRFVNNIRFYYGTTVKKINEDEPSLFVSKVREDNPYLDLIVSVEFSDHYMEKIRSAIFLDSSLERNFNGTRLDSYIIKLMQEERYIWYEKNENAEVIFSYDNYFRPKLMLSGKSKARDLRDIFNSFKRIAESGNIIESCERQKDRIIVKFKPFSEYERKKTFDAMGAYKGEFNFKLLADITNEYEN